MTVDPRPTSRDRPVDWSSLSADAVDDIAAAYTATYSGTQGNGSVPATDREVSPALMAAHERLGHRRGAGETVVAVYWDEDSAGVGPAVQIVTDQALMLMEWVTMLLHRLSVSYVAVMNPVFRVRRSPEGELLDVRPRPDGSAPEPDVIDESWMHVQLARSVDRESLAEVERLLPGVVADARQVAEDSAAMYALMLELADELAADPGIRFPGADRSDVAELLRWLADGHFVLLGCQRSTVRGGEGILDESSRLGVLRLRTDVPPQLTDEGDVVVLAQATLATFLLYGEYLYNVVIRDEVDGDLVEHRFVGLFTVAEISANVLDIPLVSRRVREVLAMSEGDPNRPAQLMLNIIQTIPRQELFAMDAERLWAMAAAIADLGSRRRALLFVRAGRLGQLVYCLVYLPRDRYTTAVRLTMQDILVREFGGVGIDYAARVSEAPWAVVHFTVRLPESASRQSVDTSDANCARIQTMLTEAARTWGDRLMDAAHTGSIDQSIAEHYSGALPEVFKQAVTPTEAIDHIEIIEELEDDAVRLVFRFPEDNEERIAELTWFLGGRSASLSQLLPMLQSMGVVVLDERPFTVVRADGLSVWIYQFRISLQSNISIATETERADTAQRFADAVTAIWNGQAEIDRFNQLVLRGGLTWQQVTVLRAYAKYLRQAGFAYSQFHIESVLNDHPHTARSLVELYEALFNPDPAAKKHDAQTAAAAVAKDIEAVVSLDTDRVLRAFASLVQATLRTNYFVTSDGSARRLGVLSMKLNPGLIDELPLPRPRFEIHVYSPRVEGVHLRFGPVARGGLRWSDRREDFRTEILGLVKAQAVKNAVIVPVGAKGGFVVKEPPLPTGDEATDRAATRSEGVACYKMFIAGLLDVTDNVDKLTGEVVTPERVVRRDGDDAYLVVAADKGTATFSDIANEVAQSYGFWLGDAFASGGSVGYDHKAMGITARGAWEAVKRHFREMGVDTQSEDFTAIGVGDMSGDVFGNGMLLSKHIRLIAAFDHRHVFLDPEPDAATSWEERKRLFELPRSCWEDYDSSLISEGGGVYSREHKSIPISAEVRRMLRLDDDVTEMAPPELIRAVLCAPVDLLFNGGIGTYIKAESESNADVGDRSNEAVRVNANQLRAKVIAEGGNLGVTSLGRIEFDLSGGRINTDALDNSAGVDCSDHEVNIKILVDSLVTAGKVDVSERTKLLESMTDEVSELVLANNAEQNDLMGTSRTNAGSLLPVHARQISELVANRGLNRKLEALPSTKEIRRRAELGLGLTSPELATLMAHVKLDLKDQVLAGELPDQEVFAARLPNYFPAQLRDNFLADIRSHQLRREIVTTMLVNDVIDCGGITYVYRVVEDASVSPIDAVRTFAAADSIFGIVDIWRRIRTEGEQGRISTVLSDRMTLDLRRLLDRSTRWLVNFRPQPLAVGAEINRFGSKVRALTPLISNWLRHGDREVVSKAAADMVSHGASEELAGAVAAALYSYSLLDVIDIADITDRDSAEVADTYFALTAHFGIHGLLTAVSELERDDRWHALARLALRDDIYGSLRSLCMDVLAVGEPEESGEQKIAEWEHTNTSRIERARRTLDEINEEGERDLATLSVAARQISSMTHTRGAGSKA